MVDEMQWPFQARNRYLRLAMEYWDLVKNAIELAKIQCKHEGQIVEEHFQSFVENSIEDCRLTRYGCLLTEKYLYRHFKVDGLDQTTKDIDVT